VGGVKGRRQRIGAERVVHPRADVVAEHDCAQELLA
jgi:hypothetical protein